MKLHATIFAAAALLLLAVWAVAFAAGAFDDHVEVDIILMTGVGGSLTMCGKAIQAGKALRAGR